MTQDANDLLMSGGMLGAKFETLGDTVIGTIVDEPKAVQMTKFKSEELDFWPSGDAKMQIVVPIQTDGRDPGNPADDGRRRLFITPRMMKPVREAIMRAGAKGLAIGGRIAVRWISGTGEGEGNAREFAADYAAPTVDPGSLLGTTAAAPVSAAPLSAAAPPPTVVPQPVAAPVLAAPPVAPVAAVPVAAPGSMLNGPTPATAAAPRGVDPAVWESLPDSQRAAILAAMSNPAATAAPF